MKDAGAVSPPGLEVAGLRKTLGGRVILDGVSFAVGRGQSLAILGPSGAGKTTLLRCINGLDRPDAGRVRLGDQLLDAGAPDFERRLPALRRRVGIVFQQFNLFAHRTVLENVVEAPVHVAGSPPTAAAARARDLLARVGVEHRARAYPHELSGGEQQRAAIARALAMDPEVLLLDEPTSALDRARAGDLMALLRDLTAGGLSLIVVSHDPQVPPALSAPTLVLNQGRFD